METESQRNRVADKQTDRERKPRIKPVYTEGFLRGTTRWLGDEGTT
jgi:hypothetical protein